MRAVSDHVGLRPELVVVPRRARALGSLERKNIGELVGGVGIDRYARDDAVVDQSLELRQLVGARFFVNAAGVERTSIDLKRREAKDERLARASHVTLDAPVAA